MVEIKDKVLLNGFGFPIGKITVYDPAATILSEGLSLMLSPVIFNTITGTREVVGVNVLSIPAKEKRQEIKPEAITAAMNVLSESLELGAFVMVSDYLWDEQTKEQREEGLRRLRIADEQAELRVRTIVLKALQAAAECM